MNGPIPATAVAAVRLGGGDIGELRRAKGTQPSRDSPNTEGLARWWTIYCLAKTCQEKIIGSLCAPAVPSHFRGTLEEKLAL